MTPMIQELRALGALTALDEHFARAMGRIGRDERGAVLLAAALVSRQVSRGHVCLDLARTLPAPWLADDGMSSAKFTWPTPDAWCAALRASPLVGDGDAVTPLVLDDAGRLYLRRYWEHEVRLAAAIDARVRWRDRGIDREWLRAALERLFPAPSGSEPDWQRVAALIALARRFCVISGGPGTGKTFTVVKLLALLVERAVHAGQPPPRIQLVAPTGKAAARLREAVRQTKQTLMCAEAVKAAIPDAAATIHRCLGSIDGSDTRFRHDARRPLLADVVLVDEASMVDLGLMARLIDAVPPAATFILLGDQDQLASVEAGAVLGDICNAGAPRGYSADAARLVMSLSGDRLPVDTHAPAAGGLSDCLVQLTRSYRYGTDSGIAALARAINAGDDVAAFAVLAAGGDVALVEPDAAGQLSASLRDAAVRGFAAYLRAPDAAAQLRALPHFGVLCAPRRGPFGVETLNRQLEDALRAAGDLRPDTRIGRPIMVTRNDYGLDLFNGDVGVIIDDPERPGATAAAFLGDDGRLRQVSPARLPPHETVFAMSIHKSQGSEFDEVAVVLPEHDSPLLSRELLYTAVTRARQRATIHASRAIVARTIARRIDRASGLRDRLWR